MDFHKNCELRRGLQGLPLSGIPIYYYPCARCGFLFTTAFDAFGPSDFARYIYNDEYALVDPDYQVRRPRVAAEFVAGMLSPLPPRNILHYGCGAGAMAALLREREFRDIDCYDPHVPRHSESPSRRYECILSVEVLEHANDPLSTVQEMLGLLDDPGIIIFSTLLQCKEIERVGLDWWYAAPRNGHVSLYTGRSLWFLLSRAGLTFRSSGDAFHVAFRNLPPFAKHLVPLGSGRSAIGFP